MEYLTLLNYLYTITYTYRTQAIRTIKRPAFFLPNDLTLLDKLFKLKHHSLINHTMNPNNKLATHN